jgi:putative ABC transport system permease protein
VRGTAAAVAPPRPLDDDAIAAIEKLDDVATVYPNIRVPVQVQFKEAIEGAAATGVPLSARHDGAFQKLSHGAFFDNDRDAACLLSLDFVKRITGDDPATLVGQTIVLSYAASGPGPAESNVAPAPPLSPPDGSDVGPGAPIAFPGLNVRQVATPYRIAGIVEREPGIAFGGFNISGVMIPLPLANTISRENVTNAQSLLRNGNTPRPVAYQSLTVRVKRAQSTTDVEDKIKTMGYGAFSVSDALEGAKRGFIILDIALALIGSIALAVSSLGIVNTMVMSILERTREIGIMKAIGGSDSDIRRIFLVEASVIGVLGGAAGVTLGWLVGRAVNFGANIYIQRQGGTPGDLFALPFWLIGGAIGFSWVVSLLAGSYPASRAARLDPIQALRHD